MACCWVEMHWRDPHSSTLTIIRGMSMLILMLIWLYVREHFVLIKLRFNLVKPNQLDAHFFCVLKNSPSSYFLSFFEATALYVFRIH